MDQSKNFPAKLNATKHSLAAKPRTCTNPSAKKSFKNRGLDFDYIQEVINHGIEYVQRNVAYKWNPKLLGFAEKNTQKYLCFG
jgi:hypothetical protein